MAYTNLFNFAKSLVLTIMETVKINEGKSNEKTSTVEVFDIDKYFEKGCESRNEQNNRVLIAAIGADTLDSKGKKRDNSHLSDIERVLLLAATAHTNSYTQKIRQALGKEFDGKKEMVEIIVKMKTTNVEKHVNLLKRRLFDTAETFEISAADLSSLIAEHGVSVEIPENFGVTVETSETSETSAN